MAAFLFAASQPAFAGQVHKADAYALPAGETAEDPLFVLSNEASVAGTAADDVFVLAGRKAELSGAFLNDVWALGQAVSFSGAVGDHGRFAGFSVHVSGSVSNGLMAAGNSVTVAGPARIAGRVYLAAENVVCEGVIDGPVRIAANRVTLGGEIRGLVAVAADDIVVLPGAVIRGDFSYASPKELLLDKSVVVEGEFTRTAVPAEPGRRAFGLMESVVLPLLFFLAACTVGIPFVALFPRYACRAAFNVRAYVFRSAFVGAIAFALLPLMGLMAALSVVGLPLSLSLFAAFWLIGYFGKFAAGAALGAALLRRPDPSDRASCLVAMLVGVVLLYIAGALPIVGSALSLAAVFLGGGGLLLALNPAVPSGRQEASPPEASAGGGQAAENKGGSS